MLGGLGGVAPPPDQTTDLVSISTPPHPPTPPSSTHKRSPSLLGLAWRWMVLLHLYGLDGYFLVPPAHLAPASAPLAFPSPHSFFLLGSKLKLKTQDGRPLACPRCSLREAQRPANANDPSNKPFKGSKRP